MIPYKIFIILHDQTDMTSFKMTSILCDCHRGTPHTSRLLTAGVCLHNTQREGGRGTCSRWPPCKAGVWRGDGDARFTLVPACHAPVTAHPLPLALTRSTGGAALNITSLYTRDMMFVPHPPPHYNNRVSNFTLVD